MNEARRELERVRRGWRLTRGRRLVDRVHLALLAAALGLALGHRLLGPWPPFESLAADGVLFYAIRVLAVALGLLLLGPLLRRLATPLLSVPPVALARELDDRLAWHDAIETAVGLPPRADRPPVEVFLVAQSAGRLRALDPRRLWPAGLRLKWVRRLLAFLFVAVLLLPGVRGMPGGRGAGEGEVGVTGTRPERLEARPLAVDEWLATHVHDPLPVEPLGLAAPAGEARDGGGR